MMISNCNRNKYAFLSIIVFSVLVGFLLPNAQAQNESEALTANHAGTTEAASEEKEFNAGETIIEHVVDAYSWHILTYKDKHVAIYLPVLIIDNAN